MGPIIHLPGLLHLTQGLPCTTEVVVQFKNTHLLVLTQNYPCTTKLMRLLAQIQGNESGFLIGISVAFPI